jgi:hypothetical protein
MRTVFVRLSLFLYASTSLIAVLSAQAQGTDDIYVSSTDGKARRYLARLNIDGSLDAAFAAADAARPASGQARSGSQDRSLTAIPTHAADSEANPALHANSFE